MLKRLKCLIFGHDWQFFETPFGIRWYCNRCRKWRDIDD